jgi:diguanylate cyclase (GGDEF)-like protein
MTDTDPNDVFLSLLPSVAEQLDAEWQTLKAGDTPEALLSAIHRLTGTALSLEYTRIGNAARRLEEYLKQPEPSSVDNLEKLVTALRAEIQACVRDDVVEQHEVSSIKNIPSLQETRSSSLIFLVEDDHVQANLLTAQISHFGYSVKTFTQLQDLGDAIQAEIPAAILMDIVFPEGEFAGVETIRAMQEKYGNNLPVFFISVRGDMAARLQSIRAGGKAYFPKPVDISALVDALDTLIASPDNQQYRVLIVDDSEVQAKVNALHLKKAGILPQVITQPLEVGRALEEFSPDLLLLDLYMPSCNGLELAQVIRQMKTFVSLPIVYLSAETDREKQLAAVGLGGDDFLTKPIKPDHLVSAVTSRIERYRQLRALMLRDSLTGLFNHTTIRERLSQEVARAVRQNQPLALAMMDIDHFKTINDTYGHATGDRVIKSLSHMLSRRLRQADIVGRYGGEEFVAILPNSTGQVAMQVMDELRESFSQVRHIFESHEFTVTLSCGVATFPEHQTPASLSEAADQAMYVAKRAGRNRVLLAE